MIVSSSPILLSRIFCNTGNSYLQRCTAAKLRRVGNPLQHTTQNPASRAPIKDSIAQKTEGQGDYFETGEPLVKRRRKDVRMNTEVRDLQEPRKKLDRSGS